jgi:hypothetical protein
MITCVKFNHYCKNVQIIDAFFWCNVSTIVINVPLIIVKKIKILWIVSMKLHIKQLGLK